MRAKRLAATSTDMRTLLATASLAATALVALPSMPRDAHATTSVLRCELPDGTHLYTNKACGSVGGKASPMDADVLDRIRSEQRREVRMATGHSGADPAAVPTEPGAQRWASAAVPVRRPVTGGCAGSPEQLAVDLQASLAMRDVNRVAESFDWVGMGNTRASQVFKQLEQMTASQQVVDADYFEASISYGGVPTVNHGLMQLTLASAQGSRVESYDVTRQQDCYFLRYA